MYKLVLSGLQSVAHHAYKSAFLIYVQETVIIYQLNRLFLHAFADRTQEQGHPYGLFLQGDSCTPLSISMVDHCLISFKVKLYHNGGTGIFTFFLLIKIEHWVGPIMVCLCLLYVMLVCVSFLYCGELTQCVCSVVFVGFRDKEIVCGIHVSFWPISIVCAVCLARFVSSSVSTY